MFLGELLPVSLAFTSSRSAFSARSVVASLSHPFLRPPRRSPSFDPPRGMLPRPVLDRVRPALAPQQPQLLTLRAHLKNPVIQNDLI
jgi:hypothetical protein